MNLTATRIKGTELQIDDWFYLFGNLYRIIDITHRDDAMTEIKFLSENELSNSDSSNTLMLRSSEYIEIQNQQ